MTTITYKKATLKERVAMVDLLKQHGRMKGDIYHYDEGWTDARVAACVSPGINGSMAKNIRIEMFGRLMLPAPPAQQKRATQGELLAAVEAAKRDAVEPLAQRVAQLSERVATLSMRLKKLETELGVVAE
jgi:hypothetical protein